MVMSVALPKKFPFSSVFSRAGGSLPGASSKKRSSPALGGDYDDDDRTMELMQLGANRPKNVLILMSDTGRGHHASAEAIDDAFKLEYGDEYNEVAVEGQDKVFKDVIEPLESVSVNLYPTIKQDIKDFGPPQEVAETLIKKALASPNQKTKLINGKEGALISPMTHIYHLY